MKSNWYQIQAMGRRRAAIFLYGPIVSQKWDDDEVTARDFMEALGALDVDDIDLHINSDGGNVFQGTAIFNALRRHRAKVTTYVDGIAASMAGMIAMAGDEVIMGEHAFLMIHNPWGAVIGDSHEMRRQAALQDAIKGEMIKAYQRRVAMTDAELSEAMDAETWYNAEDAVALGFADRVDADLQIAASLDAPIDLDRFKRAPKALKAEEPVIKIDSVRLEPDLHAIVERVIHEKIQAEKPSPQSRPETETLPLPEVNMTVEAKAPGDGPSVDNVAQIEAAAAKRALAADRSRRVDIAARFARFPSHADLMRECQDDADCTVAMAAERLLEALGAGQEPVAKATRVDAGESASDKFRKGASEWLLARAGTGGVSHKDVLGNDFRGMKLVDIARQSLELNGRSTRGMTHTEIVGAAFTHSTSDFSTVLENTMHKTLQRAYEIAPDTWRQWCAVGEVSDFRAHNRYRMGSFANLATVLENGEFTQGTIGDAEKESLTATTKGKLLSVSRQMIVNDDLGAFNGLAAAMGRAAARTVESDVYTSLTSNSGTGPTMGDAVVLFHSSHANIGTTAAITAASVDEVRQLMTAQMDPDGNDYLDIMPAILLAPDTKRATAIKVLGAEFDPDETSATGQNIPNPVRNMVSVVTTPRLSGNRWYIFANPGVTPTFEVAFLDGIQTPFLDQMEGFEVDGIMYKVRFDYAVGAVDWRGAVTNAGA